MIVVTTYIGKKIWGTDFAVEQHQELETIAAYSQLSIRTVILINAAVVAPVFEEMMFRGLFQTMIRSIIVKPWISISLSSIIFTAVHINASHWPALLVLAFTLGYAYEKSGSLLRPIIIHAIFNAAAIIAVMM
jgi:membrane protease YdiL (CAAX protease family)